MRKYEAHDEAIRNIDRYFYSKGYRRSSIYRKVIAVYFRIGRTTYYRILGEQKAEGQTELLLGVSPVERLTEIGISIGTQVLSKKDLIL